MFSMFSPDSKIMQVLARFADLVILNGLYLITCIPVFTIGAANTALYNVCFRMLREEGGVVKPYFRAFRENFKQSTPVWLLFLLLLAASYGNIMIFSDLGGMLGHSLFVLSVIILVNCMLVLGYAFPLISQFENTTGNTLKNALLLSIAHLPRSLIMAVINCFPWMLMIMNLYAFIQFSFIWFALYFAAAAYFNSRVLMHIFKPLKEAASK